jgi:hypothetical protein
MATDRTFGVSEGTEPIRLTDEQRLDWLRLIRSQNIGTRGIVAQRHKELVSVAVMPFLLILGAAPYSCRLPAIRCAAIKEHRIQEAGQVTATPRPRLAATVHVVTLANRPSFSRL